MRLHYAEIAGEAPFHAARVRLTSAVKTHTHDFHELMLVVAGEGTHWICGTQEPLQAGSLRYLRPDDEHGIVPDPTGLEWINVAFPSATWNGYRDLFEVEEPESRDLSLAETDRLAIGFHLAAEAYLQGPRGTDLARFFTAAFSASALAPSTAPVPAWLMRAVNSLGEPERLRVGLPALLAAACVSPGHLSRAVRAAYGKTPTALVNELRLERAARLLATGPDEISNIAEACGFENLSFFYRSFRKRFGITPLQHRRRAQGTVAPRSFAR